MRVVLFPKLPATTSTAVVKNTSEFTEPVVLHDNKSHHAIEYSIRGDGEAKITAHTSITGENWIKEVKAEGLTKTSGPNADGFDIIPLRIKTGDLIKFEVEETGDAEDIAAKLAFTQK